MREARLDDEAAIPIGLIFKDKSLLWDQHQVLAIGYTDTGLGEGTLEIWDNKDRKVGQTLQLDFRGDELAVTSSDVTSDNNRPASSERRPRCREIAGIFLESYSRRRPPLSLKLP